MISHIISKAPVEKTVGQLTVGQLTVAINIIYINCGKYTRTKDYHNYLLQRLR